MPIGGNPQTSNVDPANKAFYVGNDGRFEASALTRGPWDADAQHAGPPTALVGRAVERLDGVGPAAAGRRVGRITFEILSPIPIGPVAVAAEVVRPGRRVDLVEATMTGSDGELLIRARAWRLQRRAIALPAAPADGSSATTGSSRPGTRSATTPRWRAGSPPAPSSSRDRRRPGCGCATRSSPARRRRRCSGS
jgi:hypothetical protein